MMTVWWLVLVVCCCALNCAEASASSQVLQRNKYNSSFRLARSTRTRVQQLLGKYNEQQLENKDFEDRSRQINDLPLLSTDFDKWLKQPDLDRLYAAFWDMQTYWNKLECKRKQLEKKEGEKTEKHATRNTLTQSFKHIQLDLEDLMSQIKSQISCMKRSGIKPTFATTHTPSTSDNGSDTEWDQRVEGYVILRDLDLYLTKLARDFLLLASKTHP